jgi:hypothetical protein
MTTATKERSKPKVRVSVADELMSAESSRHEAAFCASYGRSASYIVRRIKGKLTRGQIYYACKLAGVKISDYRNGYGETSRIVEELTQEEVDAALYKQLEKTL